MVLLLLLFLLGLFGLLGLAIGNSLVEQGAKSIKRVSWTRVKDFVIQNESRCGLHAD